MTGDEQGNSRLQRSFGELLRSGTAHPTPKELERGLAMLRLRLERNAGQRRAPLRGFAMAAMLCCAVLGAAYFGWRQRSVVSSAPVAVSSVEGGRVVEGGYLSATGHSAIRLLFNEGSEFRLTPGSRGRLRSVSADGASFAIEHGRASFQITPERGHHWSVEAGPFSIAVTGTEFSVSWEPKTERFELRLRRGQVLVSGPVLEQELALRAGQTMVVDLPKAETRLTEEKPDDAPMIDDAVSPEASVSAQELPPAPVASSGPPLPSSTPARATERSAPASGSGRQWRAALAEGHWDRVLSDAERDGLASTLETASNEDLLALADAARYRRRIDIARAALLAARRRFPGSVETAFLLGRVEELRPGARSAALQWYDEYLTRAPRGTYAAEALGRKMILSKELGGRATAQPIAEEYLRRFPAGSYAGAARALSRAP